MGDNKAYERCPHCKSTIEGVNVFACGCGCTFCESCGQWSEVKGEDYFQCPCCDSGHAETGSAGRITRGRYVGGRDR